MQAGGKSAKPKVALVSLHVTSDPRHNLRAIAEAVERASAAECELVCFPECALTGLVETKDYESDIALATEIPGDTTDEIAALAKTYHMYIAIGILERDREQLYDTAILIDSHGDIILKYRRINPRWHVSSAPEHLYCQGTTLDAVSTPFGRIAFAPGGWFGICNLLSVPIPTLISPRLASTFSCRVFPVTFSGLVIRNCGVLPAVRLT